MAFNPFLVVVFSVFSNEEAEIFIEVFYLVISHFIDYFHMGSAFMLRAGQLSGQDKCTSRLEGNN